MIMFWVSLLAISILLYVLLDGVDLGVGLLFGLTNDAFGYILTKVDFKSFPRYDYVSRTSLGEMTGEILIENVLKLVETSRVPERLSAK